MQAKRRFWLVAALGLFLAAFAVVAAQPVALYGALGVGLWLFAAQVRFVAAVRDLDADRTVARSLSRRRTRKGDSVTLETRLELSGPVDGSVTVSNPVPAALSVVDDDAATLTAAGTARVATTVRPPITGRFDFEPAAVTVTGPFGLYAETLSAGPGVSLAVDPRTPEDVHVGQGGTRVAAAYGDHDADYGSGGLTPDELRRYVPGDPIRHVDWKATARLNERFVREFETQSDHRTVLVFDRREPMGDGPPDRRKIEYAREVALTYLRAAQRKNDPIGLLGVGTRGLTRALDPGTTAAHYRRVDRALRMESVQRTPDETAQGHGLGPATAERRAAALDDETDFARRLAPFFAAEERYVEHLREQPLFRAVADRLAPGDGQTTVVVVTDDSHRTELRETLKLVSGRQNQALVFLTPSAVFREAGASDGGDGPTYAEFEAYRRDLAAIPRVQAFEVGPEEPVAKRVRSPGVTSEVQP